jgi:hypothetical protein
MVKPKPKTRVVLMKELNELLGTQYNWSRISALDLQRLVAGIDKAKKDLTKFLGG